MSMVLRVTLLLLVLGGCRHSNASMEDASLKDVNTSEGAFCPAGLVRIPVGEDVISGDNCNSCRCEDFQGQPGFSCTELGCVNPPPVTGCRSGDIILPQNTSWAEADGCNTCTCTDRGLSCTELACAGQGGRDQDTGDSRTGGQGRAFCEEGSIRVAVGGRVRSSDNCNTCTCEEFGGRTGFMCTEIACIDPPPAAGCRSGDVLVPLQSSWPSVDGCNTCSCTEQGLACTEIACVGSDDDDSQGAAFCNAGPIRVELGEAVIDSDNCNSCTCNDYNGRPGFSCTEIACQNPRPVTGCRVDSFIVPLNSTWADADGCNSCTCTESGLACTERACG